MRIRNRELVSSGILAILGLAVVGGASEYYAFGTLGNPGPGFFPLVLGAILVILSGAGFINNLRQKLVTQSREMTLSFFPESFSAKRVMLTYLNLCFFRFTFQFLGFLPSVFLFSFLAILAMEPSQWRKSLIFSSLSAIGNYLIFSVWLQIEFPTGILGI